MKTQRIALVSWRYRSLYNTSLVDTWRDASQETALLYACPFEIHRHELTTFAAELRAFLASIVAFVSFRMTGIRAELRESGDDRVARDRDRLS